MPSVQPADPEAGPEAAPDVEREAGRDAGREGVTVPEAPKRKQILDGARRCFLASGFEAASMGEIAREAKVSKGTLYVYFDSKESLFTALVEERRAQNAEQFMSLGEGSGADVAATLTRCAEGLIRKLCSEEHVAIVRVVIGASEKFPGIARGFFESGPAHGVRLLSDYFAGQVARGRLAIADPEAAAWQFLGMCHHPTVTKVLLAAGPAPDAAEARRIAERNVATFLAAYGTGAA